MDASIELKKIMEAIGKSCEEVFSWLIETWSSKWDEFLKEKTHSETGKWFYTHKRLRSAIRSIRTNTNYLFTYQKNPVLRMPNTTNSLEGINCVLKLKVKVHQGIKLDRKKKMIDYLLGK
jgi:hypothetical protein